MDNTNVSPGSKNDFPKLNYQRRLVSLRQDRDSWLPALKDVQKYIAPTRGFFEGTMPNFGKKIDHGTILDGHATRSLNILASGMTSGLTSPTRPWFKLALTDVDLMNYDSVKEWLSIVQSRMLSVYSRSNIYGVLNSLYHEVGAFGTAAMILLEDFKTVIRGRNFTSGEYVLSAGADGRINGFGREYWMTAAQLIEDFGKENVSPQVINAMNINRPDQFFKINCLIEVNDNRISDRADFAGKPYRSVYWEQVSPDYTHFLDVRGFDEFPVLAPRWDITTTSDVYGRGPGWDALGDVKMLQKLTKTYLLALEKVADPPVQVDSNIDEVNLLPGGVTRSSTSSPNAGMRAAYEVRPDLAAMGVGITNVKQSIDSFFFADLFLMIYQADRPDMTAREIVERHEEKLLMLGPVLERLESELLDPMIERTFNIMLRAGLIPPPPPELQGQEWHVDYISMLAQAQKMVGLTAIEQTARFTGSLVSVFPGAADNFDADEAIRSYGDMIGLPPKIVRSPDKLDQLRQERAKQMQEQKAAQDAQVLAANAKVLSDTKVGNSTALDQILGVGPTAPAPAAAGA